MLSKILLSRLTLCAEKITGIISVDFDATGQLQIIYSAFTQYLRKKRECTEAVHHLFTEFKKANDSVLYNLLIESGIPMNLLTPIKMCLNEICSRVRVDKYLSDKFPIKKGLKQRDAL